jgi:Uri superfamily endonuclease
MKNQSLEQALVTIPALPGIYALQLRLSEPERIYVGALGEALFPPGDYVYVGSACGAGGLRGRLSRHLRSSPKLHWHIDYLRQVAQVVAWAFALHNRGTFLSSNDRHPGSSECEWYQALASTPGALVPLRGFGASDCTHGCPAHLALFPGGLQSVGNLLDGLGQHLDGCQEL